MNSALQHTISSQRTHDRLARRHRAEQRFRAYGLAAIVVSISFLGFLVFSIIGKAIPALTIHDVSLSVPVNEALADPLGDRSEVSLRAGSYNRMIQLALQSEFPEVTERAHLRELFRLYSPINSARLLNQVVADPSLVGQSVAMTFPISDDVDLYLKGLGANEDQAAGMAPLSVSRSETQVMLSSSQSVFEPFLSRVRESLTDQLSDAEGSIAEARRDLQAAFDLDEREVAQARYDRAVALAERLRARLNDPEDLLLTPTLPSLFIKTGDGSVLRVSQVSSDGRSVMAEAILGETSGTTIERWDLWTIVTPSVERRITDRQIIWAQALFERGQIHHTLNLGFFTHADSGEPELAGIRGAITGTILTMFVTLLLALPVGIGAAIYLEEFAPRNWFTNLVEININNLAAVPSIVFGLLGLAVFINFFGMPRSTPLVGGMVLALMTLPTVIISSRSALKAVPMSIREAALGVGASRTQAVFDHVLPLALPGMLTGSIIALAQALGETAPLLMIGMVAFIAEPPTLGLSGLAEPSTVLPVQVFLWSSGAERAFEARTALAILVLLVVMIGMNATAIYLRHRFDKRW